VNSIHRLLITCPAIGDLTGCTYLHSSERQATAEKLQQQLKTYGEHSPDVYGTMQANVDKFAVNEDAALSEIGKNAVEAMISKYPAMSDKDLDTELDNTEEEVAALKQTIRKEASDYLNTASLAKKEITDLDTAIIKMKAAVQQAESDVTKWNQTVALLKKAAADIPSVAAAGKNGKASTNDALKNLGDSLSKIGNEEVQFEDAHGKPQKKTIKAIVQENINLTDKDNVGIQVPKAPGIKLRILALGLDVAETERERTMMRLNRIHDRMLLFENVYKESLLAEQLVADAKKDKPRSVKGQPSLTAYIEGNTDDARAKRDAFIKTVKPGAPVDKTAYDKYDTALNQNAELFKILRLLTVAKAITERDIARIKVETARLNHLDSIAISKYNDRIWQLYLQAGADGLVAYHKGGFSEADAAQIVRIAQGVSVGVLAVNGTGGL
jgi:hypothetical protein